MKRRNIIITLGAAAALVIGIFVACSKDVNKQTTDNTVFPATKSTGTAQIMFCIWEKSDSAYRSNPTAFLNICSNNNYEGFLEIANISSSLVSDFENEVEKQADDALLALGTDWLPNECISCSDGGLSDFGQNVADLRRMLDTLSLVNSPDTVPNFMPYTDSCIVVCQIFKELIGEELNICLFNCNLRRAIRESENNYMAITNKPWNGFE